MDADTPLDVMTKWMFLVFIVWLAWTKGFHPPLAFMPVIHTRIGRTKQ